MSEARRRIHRYALLPHQQAQWTNVVGALKRARMYDKMVGIQRGVNGAKKIKSYTARFARGVGGAERILLVPTNSRLYDHHGTVDAVSLPRLCVAIVLCTCARC